MVDKDNLITTDNQPHDDDRSTPSWVNADGCP